MFIPEDGFPLIAIAQALGFSESFLDSDPQFFGHNAKSGCVDGNQVFSGPAPSALSSASLNFLQFAPHYDAAVQRP